MALWGSLAIVGTLAAAALALTGCTLTPYPRSSTPPTAINGAHLGQCWQVSDASFVASMIDAGRRPVPCELAHQFVTFSAFSLLSTPSSGQSSGPPTAGSTATPAPAVSDDEHDASVAAAAEAGCTTRLAKAVPELTPFEVLVRSTAILPIESAWRSGDRLIECDLSVIKIGSTVAAPQLGEVPSVQNIREAARDYYNEFDFCVNLPGRLPKDGPTSR